MYSEYVSKFNGKNDITIRTIKKEKVLSYSELKRLQSNEEDLDEEEAIEESSLI